jgi:acyl transferase domain-containing protein
MKFGANRSQLYDAQKTLRAKWDVVCELWNDSTRQEFEERVWEPLDMQTSETLRSVDQVAAIFMQLRSECEFNS